MSSKVKSIIVCIGANHKTAPIQLRESLHIDGPILQSALSPLKQRLGLLEVAALSTCNRFELIFTTTPEQLTPQLPMQALLELQSIALRKFKIDDLQKHVYVYQLKEAVEHLFSVASSIDSLVVGETQITGQFKDAIKMAESALTLGPILSRLSQEALSASKKVRTQTDIGKRTVSISHAALDLAQKAFGELSDQKLLIIGAGEMAALAGKYACQKKIKALTVANRTVSRAQNLVRKLGFGQASDLNDLDQLIAQHDVVITSTTATETIITSHLIEQVKIIRPSKPLCFVDISIPRNVDPEVAKVDDVYLFDVDDLQQIVSANREHRQSAAEAASKILLEHVENFERWLSAASVKPTITSIKTYIDQLMERELQKTLSKELMKSLSAEQKLLLQQLTESLASKIIADVAQNIQNPPSGYYQDQLSTILSLIFTEAHKRNGFES
jgi:glutamyl-tRNA reductase